MPVIGSAIAIRPMTLAEMGQVLEWIAAEGWTASRPILEAILEQAAAGCFFAQSGERAVGMVTSIRYEQTAWIGNLVVVPTCRRQGLGMQLTSHALAHLQGRGVSCIRLDADPPGVGIYQRLGFVDEVESLRFGRPGTRKPAAIEPARSEEPFLQDWLALDRRAFGDDRHGFLLALTGRALLRLVEKDRAGALRGVLLIMPTRDGASLGPWVADTVDVAARLLERALVVCEGWHLIAGLPADNRPGAELLKRHGFQPRPSSRRMQLGIDCAPGDPGRIFGMANGATG